MEDRAALLNRVSAEAGTEIKDPATGEVIGRVAFGINSHGGIDPRVPFGGAKHSGYGLEFGVEGLKAVSVPQVING